tara:strand:+ start:2713 stop:2907 length:195 start_codon:yes stop_codon:yes gene_type:complete
MKNEWVIVYSTSDVFQAEVIKQMLLSNSIDAISMNQKDSSYHFGSVNIYTKEKDMKKAKEIISK